MAFPVIQPLTGGVCETRLDTQLDVAPVYAAWVSSTRTAAQTAFLNAFESASKDLRGSVNNVKKNALAQLYAAAIQSALATATLDAVVAQIQCFILQSSYQTGPCADMFTAQVEVGSTLVQFAADNTYENTRVATNTQLAAMSKLYNCCGAKVLEITYVVPA